MELTRRGFLRASAAAAAAPVAVSVAKAMPIGDGIALRCIPHPSLPADFDTAALRFTAYQKYSNGFYDLAPPWIREHAADLATRSESATAA